MTECGNKAAATTATTFDEWQRFVQTDCRGSAQRSYATYCVTCAGTAERHNTARRFAPAAIDQATRYLTGRQDRRRKLAELEALRLLLAEHRAEYEATVFDLLAIDQLPGRRP